MLTSRKIAKVVSDIYGVDLMLPEGERSKGEMKIPRFMAMTIIYDELDMSCAMIGRTFGVRDTVVAYDIKSFRETLAKSERIQAEYEEVMDKVRDLVSGFLTDHFSCPPTFG